MSADVLNFWFNEIEQSKWWLKDKDFDHLIKERFGAIHHAASAGELSHWRETAHGRLAEIIVLDQFSRNIYRDSAQSFAYDGLALCLAQHAIAIEANIELSTIEQSFLYMPLMHSESVKIHKTAVELYQSNGQPSNLEFELKHKAIIDKFGRYPHRNKILGRKSTSEEIAFLQQPGSSF